MQIPVDVDQLTPAWFTEVLGTPVRAVEIVDAHSGTTGRARVRIDAGGEVPETLFVKLAPFDESQREFIRRVGIGVSEARFYAALGAEVPVRVPRAWHAACDDDGRYVMVLEDLLAAGCTIPRPRDDDVADMARSTVEEMGRLHAAYWRSPRFDGDLVWVPVRAGHGPAGARAKAAGTAGSLVGQALALFGEEMGPVFRRLGQLYVERTDDIFDLFDEGDHTLIHGDAHMGNMFVDAGRTGFLDWAMVGRSPGVRDVAYFCCSSLPSEVRRALQDELLARYRAALADGGVTLGEATAFDQYRLYALNAWVSSATTAAMGSKWQPEHVGRGGMARSTTAAADLDTIGLLEERLGRSTVR